MILILNCRMTITMEIFPRYFMSVWQYSKPISNRLGRDARPSRSTPPTAAPLARWPHQSNPHNVIYATVVVFWVNWLLDACCWRRLWWGGGMTPVGDCCFVWHGPSAGWASDVKRRRPLCVVSWWPVGKMMWIAGAVCHAAVHITLLIYNATRTAADIFKLRIKFE